MLETLGIGASLREARIQRGVTLEAAEAATRIRTRYLEAVEDERWDELPAEAYAKGFLRTYAAFLELDPQQYLAEFRARRREVEEPIAPRRTPPYESRGVPVAVVAAAAAVVAVVLALGAWKLAGDPPETAAVPEAAPAVTAERAAVAPPVVPAASREPARPLLLSAAQESWLEVRLRGPRGKLVWTGTLRRGRTLKLGLKTPLWIEAGRPDALRAALGPKAIPVPEATRLVATHAGLRAAA
jgi:hypothetical protein